MKTLVVGYGSMGQRHVRLLHDMGCQVAVVSQQPVNSAPCFSTLKEAMINWQPEYVVVANKTSEHCQTQLDLTHLGFQGRLLMEKPLFDKTTEVVPHMFSHAVVAYNLRCHPLIMKLKEILAPPARITTATISVGSYLPLWRPDTDYRKSYSAKREEGGGVLRDLSHELDYAALLFGPWKKLTALGGRLGNLDINSEDAYTLIMETEKSPLVTIHMNYLDQTPHREIKITTDQKSIHIDLIQNRLMVNNRLKTYEVNRDDTYRCQHELMLKGETKTLCSFKEAMDTLITIEAAEQVAASNTWITR